MQALTEGTGALALHVGGQTSSLAHSLGIELARTVAKDWRRGWRR